MFLGIYMRTYLCILLFFTICNLSSIAFATTNKSTSLNISNPAAEKWILERIAAGQVADLSLVFSDEKERVISSLFLENILTNSLKEMKVSNQGIMIFHALIYDSINLENLVIPYEVYLNYCRFENNVNFSNSHFQKGLSFEGCSFKDANFNGLKMEKFVILSKAVFAGSVDFMYADIAGQFIANETNFKSVENLVNFTGMKVGSAALFNKAFFAGPVNFGYTRITGNFEASGAQFKNVKEMVNFNSMKVGQVILHKAIFEGPVNFVNAEISVSFECHGTQFNNSEFVAEFNSMKIGHTAFFNQAVFAGPVNFDNVNISCNFEADESQFKNKEKMINFNGMKVGGTVSFSKAFFAGPVEFFDADIDGQFGGNEIVFNNPNQLINFISMKVKGCVFFHKAIFAGLVDFRDVEISGNIEFSETQFKNIGIAANFNTIRVYGSILFVNTDFSGKIYLSDASLLDLIIKSNIESYQLLPFLDISRTVIIRRLQIENIKLLDMIATSLCVKGDATLRNVSIERGAMLDYSNFQTISILDISWPKTLKLNGMTYQNIKAEPEEQSLQMLLNMINQSVYSKDVYTNLEAFFKLQGYTEKADKVFIAQKQRERKEILKRFYPSWWWNLILDKTISYGRSPGYSLVPIGIIIIFGCYLFRREDGMKAKDSDLYKYNAFWYSLGLFIPFVDLGGSRIWQPKKERWFARNYMHVHKIFGWLLIPIALAAFSGIIK